MPSLTVGLLTVGIIERLDADVIAREVQASLLIVPDREGKHAVEPWQTRLAPFGQGRQQNFRVSLGAKLMALGCSVPRAARDSCRSRREREDESTISGKHRLMTGAAGVDDRQATMPEADALARSSIV